MSNADQSRRNFLKVLAGASAALAIGGKVAPRRPTLRKAPERLA